MRELVQDDENKAVRCFLMLYGGNVGVTIGQMQKHMTSSGYPLWPAWVNTTIDEQHLTKTDAQEWLRYLFSLEKK